MRSVGVTGQLTVFCMAAASRSAASRATDARLAASSALSTASCISAVALAFGLTEPLLSDAQGQPFCDTPGSTCFPRATCPFLSSSHGHLAATTEAGSASACWFRVKG